MPKQATKACGNRYYEARMRAAKYNEKLLTRAGAAECLPGVTEDSLKKYELDITRPPNDVVALMADAYNDPTLRPWYCVHECPLGRDFEEIPEMPPERALLRLQNAVDGLDGIFKQISRIMDDGKITDEERPLIPELKSKITGIRNRSEEILAALKSAEAKGKFE